MRNKFPGHCLSCMRWTPAGEGHPQKTGGALRGLIKWRVKCVQCVERDRILAQESYNSTKR
ncbi:hypothetical protein ALP31_200179 [Pseudomonas amygdali pv. morsprunorum]|nr:hypothetical protein ALP31_200179 [Pseudomonas amygdali pv. morsprunorum]